MVVMPELFVQTFPIMARLLAKASVTSVHKNNIEYKLLTWHCPPNGSWGWLVQKEPETYATELNITKNHKILCSVIGNLIETYNASDAFLSNSMNFMFSLSKCQAGIGPIWDEFYLTRCKSEHATPINRNNLITFAMEAGGHYILYDHISEEVLTFNTDPGYAYLQSIEGQPSATFYTIKGIRTFTDYVETLAQQWLDLVDCQP